MGLHVVLELDQSRALIVGAGAVATRKAKALLDAQILTLTVIAPEASAQVVEWAEQGRLTWHQRPWQASDLDAASLVFVATDDEALNAQIAQRARGLNLWVSVASAPGLGNMQSSAPLLKGPLELTIWSDGAGPAFTLRLRQALSEWLDGGWVQAAQWFAQLRPSIRALGTAAQRAAFWRALAKEAPALMAEPPEARLASLDALLKEHGLAP